MSPDECSPNHPRNFDHAALAESVLRDKPVLFGKLRAACDVDEVGAHAAMTEVLRFMNLCAYAATGPLTPSQRVDDAWHELILCTGYYADFCDRHFGRFVHHDPGGSDDQNARQFRETLRLYSCHFGTPPDEYWGHRPATAPTADCGGCESP